MTEAPVLPRPIVSARTPAVTEPSGPSARRPRTVRVAAGLLFPVLSLAGALVLWSAVSWFVLSPERQFLLPPPNRVLTQSLLDWKHLSPMLEALAVTARVPLIGLCFGYGMTARTLVASSSPPFPSSPTLTSDSSPSTAASTTCSHSAGHPDEIAW